MMLRSATVLHRLAPIALAASLLLGGREAHADSVTAEALFQAGREAMDKGDAKTACDRFEESYRLEAQPGTALNLANCREQLGQVASAWQRFQEAAQRLPADDPRLAIAKQRAEALAAKVPKLRLTLPEDARGWIVRRDGAELGAASLNLPLPVDPGEHLIEVTSAGRLPWTQSVNLSLGEQREVMLEQGEPAPNASSRDAGASADSASISRSTWGWVLGGVGVAGVATSLVTGGMVMSKSATVDRECVDKRCSQAGLDAAESGRALSTVSTIAAAAGALSLGFGIYFLVSDDGPAARAGVTPSRTQLGLVSRPGGMALTLRSSFE